MAIRDFEDAAGVAWRVWDVRPEQPSLLERRHVERRVRSKPIDFAERRTARDRRTNLSIALSQGWLVFRSDSERRRLFGAERNLEEASVEELRSWLAHAQAAPAHLLSLDRIES